MIWYRHWLELRRPAAALLALALASGFFFARSLDREVGGLYVGNEPLRRGIARSFGPLLAELTPTQTVAVAVHAQSTIYLILLAFLVLGGNGLRVVEFQPSIGSEGDAPLPVRSAPYTLSLPLSRTRLIVTRAAAAYAAGVLFFAASLLVHRLAIAKAGHDVPLLPMLMVTLFATVIMLLWSTVLSLLTWMFGATIGLFVTLIAALIANVPVYGFMADVAVRQREVWQIVPWLLAMIAGVVYLTARLVEDEEF
jgi:hypothetical protein